MTRFAFVLVLALAGSLAAAQPREAAPAGSIAAGQSISGELSSNDAQRRSGKYEDVYILEGRRGARIDLRLNSDAFDAYLVVTGPEGFNLSNDDDPGGAAGALHSRLVMELPSDGRYRVAVTTFRAGETGAYRLSAAVPPADAELTRAEPAEPIRLGAEFEGSLVEGDAVRGGGEFVDRYRFTARRGQRVRIEMSSTAMDTHLTLSRPDGTQDVNDDTQVDGRTSTDSRIDTVLAEDGEYVISASSYRGGETGAYRLSLAESPGIPRQASVPGGPRVLALLIDLAVALVAPVATAEPVRERWRSQSTDRRRHGTEPGTGPYYRVGVANGMDIDQYIADSEAQLHRLATGHAHCPPATSCWILIGCDRSVHPGSSVD